MQNFRKCDRERPVRFRSRAASINTRKHKPRKMNIKNWKSAMLRGSDHTFWERGQVSEFIKKCVERSVDILHDFFKNLRNALKI